MEKFYRDIYIIMYRLRDRIKEYEGGNIIETFCLLGHGSKSQSFLTYSNVGNVDDIFNFLEIKTIVLDPKERTEINEFFRKHKI